VERAPVVLPDSAVRRCSNQSNEDHQAKLHPWLCVGEGCSAEEKESFVQYLLTKHQVFALSDSELI